MKNVGKLIVSLFVPLAIGFIGSIFTRSAVNSWYNTIDKPVFNPPNWLFAPVWTALFILMGSAFYLVWEKGYTPQRVSSYLVYSGQLVLNLLWSVFFFGLKNPLLGLIDIILLWGLILLNILLFYRIRAVAGLLLIPYLLWVSFAAILNLSIVILNLT